MNNIYINDNTIINNNNNNNNNNNILMNNLSNYNNYNYQPNINQNSFYNNPNPFLNQNQNNFNSNPYPNKMFNNNNYNINNNIYNQNNNNNNYNPANIYNNNNNNSEEGDNRQFPFSNNSDIPMENKDNNIGHDDSNQNKNETPGKESTEVANYLLEYEKEQVEEEPIKKELVRAKTLVYQNDINTFSFNNFTKAPTTYISNNNILLSYMTCVLQCLANIEPIAKHFLNGKKFYAQNMNKCPFNYAFSRIIANMYSYPEEEERQYYQNFDVNNLKQLLIKSNCTFDGNYTHDAKHFISFFLCLLENEQNSLYKNENKQNNNNNKNNNDINTINVFKNYYSNLLEKCNSVFFNCFNFIYGKKLTCVSKHTILKFENFLNYEIDIQKIINRLEINNNNNPNPEYNLDILNCIKISESTNKNQLFNLYCEKCKKKTPITQRNSIYISPNYFIFLIGLRDNESEIKNNNKDLIHKFKIKKKEHFSFKIEEEIDLSEIIENKENNRYVKYQLIGLVVYNFDEEDKTRLSYVSYYKNFKNKCWYKYTENIYEKIGCSCIPCIINEIQKSSLFPCIFIYKHK